MCTTQHARHGGRECPRARNMRVGFVVNSDHHIIRGAGGTGISAVGFCVRGSGFGTVRAVGKNPKRTGELSQAAFLEDRAESYPPSKGAGGTRLERVPDLPAQESGWEYLTSAPSRTRSFEMTPTAERMFRRQNGRASVMRSGGI
jgi:hypothetical protein